MSELTGNLQAVVVRNTDGSWSLHEPLAFTWRGHDITIPARFTCDLSSIPAGFKWLFSDSDLSISAPVAHDFLYRRHGWTPTYTFTRAQADLLFRVIQQARRVPFLSRWITWAAVRVGGWWAWKRA